MPQSPALPAKHADDSHRIHALPKGCAPCSGESRLLHNVPATPFVVRRAPSISLPQTSPLRPRESASSNRKKANHEDHGHDRMHSPSDRFDSAPIPTLATSSIVLPWHVSFHKNATWQRPGQDGLHTALTAKQPLKDAAAVNATRWALYGALQSLGWPLSLGTGGRHQVEPPSLLHLQNRRPRCGLRGQHGYRG
jgi:hypothetical protein